MLSPPFVACHVSFWFGLAPSTFKALNGLWRTFFPIETIVENDDGKYPMQCEEMPGISMQFIHNARSGWECDCAVHVRHRVLYSVNYLHDGEPKH